MLKTRSNSPEQWSSAHYLRWVSLLFNIQQQKCSQTGLSLQSVI